LEEPYYTWMNVGIKSAGNLQFINPGTKYLGHDGRVFEWPINPENGHNTSWYDQNDFGSYKSYHVVGRPAEFFGGYWHDEDFGMAHFSPFADKPGRKSSPAAFSTNPTKTALLPPLNTKSLPRTLPIPGRNTGCRSRAPKDL
jgi:hypothetical protein